MGDRISRRIVLLGAASLAACSASPAGGAIGSPATGPSTGASPQPAPSSQPSPSPAPTASPVARAARPAIRHRSEWGADLPVKGHLQVEATGEVKFLLVHHTESPCGTSVEAARDQLREAYRLHTSSKGWPDIAYNFLVDPGGRIWEGRSGSLVSPVMGSATGGSQGHAILCCFLGDFRRVAPTSAAMSAMVALLAWQASVYRIDLWAGHTIKFVSRGSNRWPAGSAVVTDPIAGHREMSLTDCPGDALYPLIRSVLLPKARALS